MSDRRERVKPERPGAEIDEQGCRSDQDVAHGQSAAARRPDPGDVGEGGRGPRRRGRARPSRRHGRAGGGRPATGRRHHGRQRRRDVEAELRHLREGPAARLRRGVRPAVLLRRPCRLPPQRRDRRREPGAAEAHRPRLQRRDLRERPGGRGGGHRQPSPCAGPGVGDRDVHERGVAGCHLPVLRQRLLPLRRGVRVRHRRRDAPRVRGDRGRGHHAAAGLPGPGHGPALGVRAHGHRRVPSPRRHEHRGAQPRGARHPRRSAAHAPLLGQLPRAAPPRCRSGRHPRPRLAGRAADDPVRGRQPPSRARVVAVRGHEACPTTRSSAPA